jgi:replicative DNA helicase
MSNKQEEQMGTARIMATEKMYERPLPHNYEAERLVLGAMLVDPDAFDEATNVVDETDFFRVAHQYLFETMVDVLPSIGKDAGRELHLKAMEAALREAGYLDAVGGVAYMEMLVADLPNTTHVTHYARIVKEKSTLRELIYAAGRILSAAYVDLNEKEPDTH